MLEVILNGDRTALGINDGPDFVVGGPPTLASYSGAGAWPLEKQALSGILDLDLFFIADFNGDLVIKPLSAPVSMMEFIFFSSLRSLFSFDFEATSLKSAFGPNLSAGHGFFS